MLTDIATDRFTNVPVCVTAIINALIERFGCLQLQLWVLGILPGVGGDEE